MARITDDGGAEVVEGEDVASEVAAADGLGSPQMFDNDSDSDEPEPEAETKSDDEWTYEEGPRGGDRWVRGDEVRYSRPAGADPAPDDEPGGGEKRASDVEVGDQLVIDGEEAEVDRVSDMGGGFFIAGRTDGGDVVTARVGPNHEFEKPSDDGPVEPDLGDLYSDDDPEGRELRLRREGDAVVTGTSESPVDGEPGLNVETEDGREFTVWQSDADYQIEGEYHEGGTVDTGGDEPDPTDGPGDFSSVDFTDGYMVEGMYDNESYELSRDATEEFWSAVSDVNEEGAEKYRELAEGAKESSYSSNGQKRERALLEAAGDPDENYRNDTIMATDPSDDLVEAADAVMQGSREMFEELHDGSATAHRGVAEETHEDILADAIMQWADDGEVGEIEASSFALDNYTLDRELADEFAGEGGKIRIDREITTDELYAWPDGINAGNHSEGEVTVEGGDRTFGPDQLKVGDTPLDEALEDPDNAGGRLVRDLTIMKQNTENEGLKDAIRTWQDEVLYD